MVQWLSGLPKSLLVALVLSVGILFIVLSDPPRTVCDSQIEKFKETTSEFLSLDPLKKPNRKQTRFAKLVETCKSTNSSGGCYELFYSVKQMLKEAETLSPECRPKLAGLTGYSATIWETASLMSQIAWGAKPPVSVALKVGWFDPADLNLFCQLKESAIQVFGEARWNTFADGFFKTLPGAQEMDRNEAWQRMLLSLNCSGYI
jgi:hypothetical protein